MKSLPLRLLCGSLLLFGIAIQARSIKVEGTPAKADKLEIVVPEATPLLDFTASRLKLHLEKVCGSGVPVVKAPTDGAVSIVLGDNALSRAAGIDVDALPSEGYAIRRQGQRIFIAGRDSKDASPKRSGYSQAYKRATLSGALDFLERFADVRFYFPGEMGTIVPSGTGVQLPPVIDIIDGPDYSYRRVYSGHTNWWQEDFVDKIKGYSAQVLSLRLGEFNIPYTHGLSYLNYIERFGKTHPEYFVLKPDGTRYCNPTEHHPGQLCFTSAIKEEIYQDVKAYFQGRPSSERGVKYWRQAAQDKYFCIMPQDGLVWCGCENCAKICSAGSRYSKEDPEGAKRANRYLWQFTADIANRLTADGIDGIVTQMPYGIMKPLPDIPLPKNISLQVAVKGLGIKKHWAEDREIVKAWYDKTGSPLSVWTYPGKHMSKATMKGIPAIMFHQMNSYFQYMRPYVSGAFIEDETDYELFNHLDYYVYSKTAWNLDTDVELLLKDYYAHMYGPAASDLEAFFNELEQLWCEKVLGNTVDTSVGPLVKLPTDFAVWQNIYSPAKRQSWLALFDRAEKKAANAPEALKRVQFMRKEYLGRILAEGKNFDGRVNLINDWKFSVPGTLWLRPFAKDVNEVSTKVDIKRENGKFTFTFDCQEPRMADLRLDQTERDAPLMYADSCVEIFLNPSGDRKTYFHFIVNAKGVLYDSSCKLNEKMNLAWNCEGATTSSQLNADGYTVTLSVPEASIGAFNPKGFPVNFARHRSLKGDLPKEIYYQWSPVPGQSFSYLERFGVMALEPIPDDNLLKDADFQEDFRNIWQSGPWTWRLPKKPGGEAQKKDLDKTIFLFGRQSAHLTNVKGQNHQLAQAFKGLKPNTSYRLSFFLRLQNIENGELGAGAWMVIGNQQYAFPRNRLTGTLPWHQLVFDFTTKPDVTPDTKCSVALWIWQQAGDLWVDHVKLTENK